MLIDILNLIRIRQWYKNLVIFLPIVFSGNLFDVQLFILTVVGCVAFAFASSANYVMNDLIDKNRDKKHPEKSQRPIAAGRISTLQAIVLLILLLLGSLGIGYVLNPLFCGMIIAFIILMQAYTFLLKHEMFIDVIVVATGFVIRTVSGSMVVLESNLPYVEISPWLILCTFFLALFMVVSKRKADISLMGKAAAAHKRVLKQYSESILAYLLYLTSALLLISYALYIILNHNAIFLVTLPVVLYIVFRYIHIVENHAQIARHPETAYKDKQLSIAVLLCCLLVVVLLYIG